MRTYESFVEELRPLREEIRELRKQPGLSRSDRFKTWRHAMYRVLGAMQDSGYSDTGCHLMGRPFTPTSAWDPQGEEGCFNTALDDTRIELDSIFAEFDKHGAPVSSLKVLPPEPSVQVPPPPARDVAPVLLPKPAEITLDWIRTNITFAYWRIAAVFTASVFALGFGAGHEFESIVDLVRRNAAGPSSAADTQPKPVPRAAVPVLAVKAA